MISWFRSMKLPLSFIYRCLVCAAFEVLDIRATLRLAASVSTGRHNSVVVSRKSRLRGLTLQSSGDKRRHFQRHAGWRANGPVSAFDFVSDGIADGDGDELHGTWPVAPEDELGPGVTEHVSGLILPDEYSTAPAYFPSSEDRVNPFPKPYPDSYSGLDQQAPVSTDSEPLRNVGLVCASAPQGWVDSGGASCVQYSKSSWCKEDGREGSGWAVVSNGQSLAAFGVNGVDATQACCECGGGRRVVTIDSAYTRLSHRRLVAPEDRSPNGPVSRRSVLSRSMPENPISPWRPLMAPKDHVPLPVPPVAPHDDVPLKYAHYFQGLYDRSLIPDPMGLSVRFYGFRPSDACTEVPGASAIDLSLDYSGDAGSPRSLQQATKDVTLPGGIVWGRWTGSLKIEKAGNYTFDLNMGFSALSSLKVDGLELVSYGQCHVSTGESDCTGKGCKWTSDGKCLPPLASEGAAVPVHDAATTTTTTTTTLKPVLVPAAIVNVMKDFTQEIRAPQVPEPQVSQSCPKCADGFCLTPIARSACPTKVYKLKDCDKVGPGELCETDGECDLDTSINNCRRYDVYRKDGPVPGTGVAGTTSEAAAAPVSALLSIPLPESASLLPNGQMAMLGERPGEIVLAQGVHCIDAVVMLPSAGRRLELFYAGPDSEELVIQVPGPVLFCDPVIVACQNPEVAVCDNFRAKCANGQNAYGMNGGRGPPVNQVYLTHFASAGDTVIKVNSAEGFPVGTGIRINLGGQNDEFSIVAGSGLIVLSQPLRFDHLAGEIVVTWQVGLPPAPAPAPSPTGLPPSPGPAPLAM
eukprot:TRINITY_DN2134_c0_g1_i1.p1 TRINITY_DN2134_c0_g1~~TRINITY_DN2134_c0_g1_i1.p1  ORF type:complete len:804 (-),score=72.14 TRINITY_DN2134_c0_g1_i1:156-2567(-)